MQPRQSWETLRPVDPKFTYFIELQIKVRRQPGWCHSSALRDRGPGGQQPLDAAQRVLERLHAARERDPDVTGRAEAGPRHDGNAGFDQQVLGEGVVVLDAEGAHGAADIGEGVEVPAPGRQEMREWH